MADVATIANTASKSLYGPALESVAPNITNLIDAVQTPGEAWTDALARALPFLSLTDTQKAQVSKIANAALNNLPAPNFVPPAEQLQTLMLYGSIALMAWRFIKGI